MLPLHLQSFLLTAALGMATSKHNGMKAETKGHIKKDVHTRPLKQLF